MTKTFCPTCGKEGRVLNTWSRGRGMAPSVFAQNKCPRGHVWPSMSVYNSSTGHYETKYKDDI